MWKPPRHPPDKKATGSRLCRARLEHADPALRALRESGARRQFAKRAQPVSDAVVEGNVNYRLAAAIPGAKLAVCPKYQEVEGSDPRGCGPEICLEISAPI